MDRIVATVGRNPLPVIIAARGLRRLNGATVPIILLHSGDKGTRSEAENIARHLESSALMSVDPEDAGEVRALLNQWAGARTHLHYTSGLRFTGFAALEALGNDAGSSYLDSETGILTTDNAVNEVESVDCPDSVSTTVDLHGFEPLPPKKLWSTILGGQPWSKAAEEILMSVLSGMDVECAKNAIRPVLSASCVNQALVKPFLESDWFEFCGYLALKRAFDEDRISVPRQYRPKLGGTPFELDGAAIKGWRFLGVSVTTGSLEKVKKRAFEVVFRSRQVGGSAARCAVLSLRPKSEVQDLAASVRDHLDVTKNGLFVIGRDDLDSDDPIESLAAHFKRLMAAGAVEPSASPVRPRLHSTNAEIVHVVAAVGSNPVPVAVSLRWMLAERFGGKCHITLLHSPESAEEAGSIRDHLVSRGLNGAQCTVAQADAQSRDSITKIVGAIQQGTPNAFFVLNVTGGKRTFSFQGFRAFDCPPEYCYLSPTSHRLLWSDTEPTSDLRKHSQCDLTFEELCMLNHLIIAEKPATEASKAAILSGVLLPKNLRRIGSVKLTRKHSTRQFQFDDGFILGHQLVVIQVATSPGDLKLRAMEAMTRARQVGGASAHLLYLVPGAALTGVEQDLLDTMGTTRAAIRIRASDRAADAVTDLLRDLDWE